MKCPKCGVNLLEHIEVCPFCKTPVSVAPGEVKKPTFAKPETGKFASVDPKKDSYDFDLQYTLTFRDSGEIKQAIEDIDASAKTELPKQKKSRRSESDAPRYTLEEMQEAALRAQQRRENRNASNSGKRNAGKKRVTLTERKKQSALRAAREKKVPVSEKKPKSHIGILLGAVVVALVVALIVGVVNIFAYFAHRDVEYPTVFTKNNELYSYYDGDMELLTSNFITILDDGNDTYKKSSDPKIPDEKAITEKSLVHVSDNGAVIYFLENVNMETRAGNLVYYESGRKKSKKVLDQNVYYDIHIGSDGASVLYVKNADKDGDEGELCFYTPSEKESVAIESGVSAGNFALAYDCKSVTYIRNFDDETHSGDLCYISLAKGSAPAKRVDEKVAFVFGTTPKSNTYFYAKNYDTEKKTYDLYVQSDAEGPKAIAEKAYLAPVISKKTETALVYSNYKNNFQTLSCVDLTTGLNTKLADEVTEIIKVRIDDGAVIYSKAYESEKADYYFVNTVTPNPQTVATAINTTAVKKDGIIAFDASDDFSRIAYIGGFDNVTKRGALFTLSVINDYAGSEMRISDDAYSCDVSTDGAVVRFAAGYNPDFNTVNLVSYLNSTTLALSDGVAAGAFTFDKMGDWALYAKDVNSDNVVGRIESVNKKAKIRQIDDGVSAYGLKKNGSVLLLKRVTEGETNNTTLYKTTLKGGREKLISDGIGKVISY